MSYNPYKKKSRMKDNVSNIDYDHTFNTLRLLLKTSQFIKVKDYASANSLENA